MNDLKWHVIVLPSLSWTPSLPKSNSTFSGIPPPKFLLISTAVPEYPCYFGNLQQFQNYKSSGNHFAICCLTFELSRASSPILVSLRHNMAGFAASINLSNSPLLRVALIPLTFQQQMLLFRSFALVSSGFVDVFVQGTCFGSLLSSSFLGDFMSLSGFSIFAYGAFVEGAIFMNYRRVFC